MQVERYAQRFRLCEDVPIALVVKKAVLGLPIDDCSFEAQLQHCTLQFVSGGLGLECGQGSEPSETPGILAHMIGKLIVDIPCQRDGIRCGDPFQAWRHERKYLHLDFRLVHRTKPGFTEI